MIILGNARHVVTQIYLRILDASSLGPSDEEEYKRRRRSVDNAENSFPDDEDDSPGSGSLDEEDDLDEEFIESEKVAILMAEEDDNYLSSLGHQFQDMVLSCTFRGMSCRCGTLRHLYL